MLFSDIAKSNKFKNAFGGWYQESDECIIVLYLQKSNHGDYFEMSIKVYVQGILGNRYRISKHLIKRDVGDIFRRHPSEYSAMFDFDTPMDKQKRRDKLEVFFSDFVVPFTDKALSKSGIMELAKNGDITLLPAVKSELAL